VRQRQPQTRGEQEPSGKNARDGHGNLHRNERRRTASNTFIGASSELSRLKNER
jgi:hypothetical protein